MTLVTVRFDRVFDKVPPSGRQTNTIFSFGSDLGTQYGVAIPGNPRIDAGMTVTAVLARADNWHSLLGWRDHASGDIVIKSEGKSLFALMACPVATAELFLAHAPVATIATLLPVIVVAASFALWKTVRITMARRALTR